jgi:hypothetical protein
MITELETTTTEVERSLAAIPAEHIHSLLRGMSDLDWESLKSLMCEHISHSTRDEDIDVLARMFRKREAIGGQAGGTIFRMMEEITRSPVLIDALKTIEEQMRSRIRFVLREMSDQHWSAFRLLLECNLSQPTKADDISVLELVFRIGESVSNIEITALAMAERQSGRKLIAPEVARRNAMVTVVKPGAPKPDPEAAYLKAKQAIDEALEIADRAERTLAYRYAEPTAPFKHARNTVFKMVQAILNDHELRAEAERLFAELSATQPVSREQMRRALHRMPMHERMEVIKLIPLNTILMFSETENSAGSQDVVSKATRDRCLAYRLFVKGEQDSELMSAFGFSINALKNAVGVILQILLEKPLARKRVLQYLDRMAKIELMGVDEVRRRMKQLPPTQRALILNAIPNSAWKVREIIHAHKHLFLDYLSGEWVLGALVEYYNLEKSKRLVGAFHQEGNLTARGAQSAILGILTKIADEPELRQRLRDWTSSRPNTTQIPPEPFADEEPPEFEELLPPSITTKPDRLRSLHLQAPVSSPTANGANGHISVAPRWQNARNKSLNTKAA